MPNPNNHLGHVLYGVGILAVGSGRQWLVAQAQWSQGRFSGFASMLRQNGGTYADDYFAENGRLSSVPIFVKQDYVASTFAVWTLDSSCVTTDSP